MHEPIANTKGATHAPVLLSGKSHEKLANAIASHLGIPLAQAFVGRFADGETRVEIRQNIRGANIYLIQPTFAPANENIMEALIMIDACRRASAGQITFVCPYFGYSRQERKSIPRTPITAKLVAQLFEAAGIDRVLALELHNSAIQGFFSVPVDHLYARPIFLDYLKTKSFLKDPASRPIVVSPDAGGVERARSMARTIGCGMAIIDKRRDKPNDIAVMHLIGDVKGYDCLILDDIVDTGSSLVKAAETLAEYGARSIFAAITHPVLSAGAVERINASVLTKLIVTDTIPLSPLALGSPKLEQVSVAELLAKAIDRIESLDSVSSLY